MTYEELAEKLRKAYVEIDILGDELRRGAAIRDDLRDEIERLKEENRRLREGDVPVIVEEAPPGGGTGAARESVLR